MTSPTVLAPTVKAGWKTSELYAVLAPLVLTALTMIFHQDFSGYVQAAGLAVSGVAAAAYAVSRAHLKRPVDLAALLYDVKALLPIGKDVAAVAVEVKAAAPKKITLGQAGHSDTATILLVLAVVGVFLLLFGVTLR